MGAREDPDEEELLAALRRGDEQAFVWLVDRYDGLLRRVAGGMVSSRTLADEVVQETWLGVVNGLDRFEGRSSLKTWIFRIMMNIARTRRTREARTVPFSALVRTELDHEEPAFAPERFQAPGSSQPGAWAAPPAPWDEQPDGALQAGETLVQVRAAIGELPLAQRTVITLRDLDGWSAEEVCDLLEISPGNQRVLLHRARARVRTALDEYFGGGER